MSDDALMVKGFFRLQLEEDGQIVGDSGWVQNQVTNDGKLGFLVKLLGNLAGSSQLTHIAIGTGTAPGAAATSLNGEITDATNSRKALTASTVAGSTSLACYATFASSDNHITTSHNISNIGLFATSQTNAGTIFAGNTYTSSSWAVNQNLNVTYTLQFS